MSFSFSTCYEEKKPCVGWIERYFKDCVCDLRGDISFGLGLASLFCWGIAEIPQIITNFQTKSGHGVSLAFLLTWVVGDIFNLVGCLLEPVTLPTQYYTALLYTIATVVLVLQTIYYDYCRKWWKNWGVKDKSEATVEEGREGLIPKLEDKTKTIASTATAITATSTRASPRIDMYYTSARSLASSGTPPTDRFYYLRTSRSGPPTAPIHNTSSSDDDDDTSTAGRRCPPTRPNRLASRTACYGTLIASSFSFPYQGKALKEARMMLSGKILLEESIINHSEANTYGVLLGWIMAAIYIGGRLPQIYLNIKRGGVEGLNPLMFLFALIANVTYVGSILVRSMEWERIKDNSPWLLDAIVCVLLDLFIILQYAHYKLMQRRAICNNDDYGACEEAKKTLV